VSVSFNNYYKVNNIVQLEALKVVFINLKKILLKMCESDNVYADNLSNVSDEV